MFYQNQIYWQSIETHTRNVTAVSLNELADIDAQVIVLAPCAKVLYQSSVLNKETASH